MHDDENESRSASSERDSYSAGIGRGAAIKEIGGSEAVRYRGDPGGVCIDDVEGVFVNHRADD